MSQSNDASKNILLYVLCALVALLLWRDWKGKDEQATKESKQTAAVASASSDRVLSAVPANRRLHVTTDVMNVDIDLQGGHLIEARLQDYMATKGGEPIKLLSTDAKDYYTLAVGMSGDTGLRFIAERNQWTLDEGEEALQVNMASRDASGVIYRKRYTFYPGRYDIKVEQSIYNQSGQPWNGHFYQSVMHANPEEKPKSWFNMGQLNTFQGFSHYTDAKPYTKVALGDLNKHNPQPSAGGWIAYQQHYFLGALIAGDHNQYRVNSSTQTYPYAKGNDNVALQLHRMDLVGEPVKVMPGEDYSLDAIAYIGPELTENLAPLADGLDLTIDYGFLWWISDIIYRAMSYIYMVLGNWGWSIVVMTLLIKLLLYHFSEKSYRSMVKMQKLKPKIEALQKKHAEDKQRLAQATMELYRSEKVNPMSGCLPLLVQMPIFFALYWVLIESVELRHAPFGLWIQDLSAADPFYVLPVLMGLSMVVQQKLTPSMQDPAQAKAMMIMPVILTALFLSFPSGLVLYMLTNNVLSLLQQWWIMKQHAA